MAELTDTQREVVDALIGCLPMHEDGTGHVADCGFDWDATVTCGCYTLPDRLAAVVREHAERALAEVEQERDEIAGRLSNLLCDLTGGLLSKTGYSVRDMAAAIESEFEKVTRQEVTAALDEIEKRITHGPHRLGHNVSVVCSCVRCEATHACLRVVRDYRQEQDR